MFADKSMIYTLQKWWCHWDEISSARYKWEIFRWTNINDIFIISLIPFFKWIICLVINIYLVNISHKTKSIPILYRTDKISCLWRKTSVANLSFKLKVLVHLVGIWDLIFGVGTEICPLFIYRMHSVLKNCGYYQM